MRNERRQEQQNEENKKREEATASILIDNGNATLTNTYIPILSRVPPQLVRALCHLLMQPLLLLECRLRT